MRNAIEDIRTLMTDEEQRKSDIFTTLAARLAARDETLQADEAAQLLKASGRTIKHLEEKCDSLAKRETLHAELAECEKAELRLKEAEERHEAAGVAFSMYTKKWGGEVRLYDQAIKDTRRAVERAAVLREKLAGLDGAKESDEQDDDDDEEEDSDSDDQGEFDADEHEEFDEEEDE
jgi:hypothetical protein